MEASLSSCGGDPRSIPIGRPSYPQQTGEPSRRRAQVKSSPLLMEASVSFAGGDDLPHASSPQQTGVPSMRMPQAWELPALMAANRSPPGGEALPT